MKSCIYPARHAQQGFSLIEVLVAVLILSIGLLGAAALQLLSLQNVNNAELRTQASLFAQELSELARTAGSPNDFVINGGSTGDCSGLAPDQFKSWCTAMRETLPGATFVSEWVSSDRDFITTITWPERMMFLKAAENNEAGEATSTYTLVTRFPQ